MRYIFLTALVPEEELSEVVLSKNAKHSIRRLEEGEIEGLYDSLSTKAQIEILRKI